MYTTHSSAYTPNWEVIDANPLSHLKIRKNFDGTFSYFAEAATSKMMGGFSDREAAIAEGMSFLGKQRLPVAEKLAACA